MNKMKCLVGTLLLFGTYIIFAIIFCGLLLYGLIKEIFKWFIDSIKGMF